MRPLPGLPVGEIEVPRVTNGEDLDESIIVMSGYCFWEGTAMFGFMDRGEPGPADGFWSTSSTTLSG